MSMNIDRPKVWRHSLIRVYLALEKLEENPTPLFSRLDITLEDLLAKDYWLDAEAFERLLVEASTLVKRKDFGLYVGECVAPLGSSPLNWAMALSETPIKAIKRYADFATLINPAWRAEVKAHGNEHVLTTWASADQTSLKIKPFQEDMLMSSLLTMSQHLLPSNAGHAGVELTQKQPDDPTAWYERFGEKIIWAAPAPKMRWKSSDLQGFRLDSNEDLAQAHEVLLRQQLVQDGSMSVKLRVESELTATLLGGSITQQCIAENLGIEVRTLQRNLKAEGTSFRELQAEARKDHAVNQLRRNTPIGRISHELGYTDQSAFSKAFKKWFGVSPANYFKAAKPY